MSAWIRLLGQNVGRRLHNINITNKRFSHDNQISVEPSSWTWRFVKNWVHFYLVVGGVPLAIFASYVNIRANPELCEVPEGYEPRHWEYYKHPVSRWMARVLNMPPEVEHEMFLSHCEHVAQSRIINSIRDRVDTVMAFYNDHRGGFFQPFYGEYFRYGRDSAFFGINAMKSMDNIIYDEAVGELYKDMPPVEGYKD